MRTFCNLEVGARVYAMKGETQRLVNRAGRVAEQARKAVEAGGKKVAGGLVVYCGGCKIAVGEDISQVSDAVVAGHEQDALLPMKTTFWNALLPNPQA